MEKPTIAIGGPNRDRVEVTASRSGARPVVPGHDHVERGGIVHGPIAGVRLALAVARDVDARDSGRRGAEGTAREAASCGRARPAVEGSARDGEFFLRSRGDGLQRADGRLDVVDVELAK